MTFAEAAVTLGASEIAAIGTVLVGLIGGVEMRLAISRLHAKVDRLEERLGTVERKAERETVPAE